MVKKYQLTKYLLVIFIAGFLVRLYGFNNPVADWHSWRQADTSSVSRNFVTRGYNLLEPRYDDLSNLPSGFNNLEGYRFVEFPIYNLLQAGSYQLIGIFTLEQWGRLITILASLVAGLFLYKLVTKHAGELAGLSAVFFYTFFPYNIYFGRTILPDFLMVCFILGGLYFFDVWLSQKNQSNKFYLGSLILTTLAFLVKPYAIFYGPVFLVLAYSRFGFEMVKQWRLWLFFIGSIIPLAAWRVWMLQHPEGIAKNDWLFNGNNIRFRPAFFRWLGYERLIKLISGYTGIIFFLTGLYQLRFEKDKLFYLAFIVGAVLYTSIFATGNVQHDYYQIVIMPMVALFYGLGIKYLLGKSGKVFSMRGVALGVITILAFSFSWQQVKDFFNINNPAMIIAGEAVDKLVPKSAKVIASYGGDTAFLYQTKRQGWPIYQEALPAMIKRGADYIVFLEPVPPSDLALQKEYKTVAKTKEYILYDLRQKP